MHRSTMKRSASLKLFPRLATPKFSQRVFRFDRPAGMSRLKTTAAGDQQDTNRANVKARLLRMILKNEQTRRNGPTAG
jgi:hypothetical protein